MLYIPISFPRRQLHSCLAGFRFGTLSVYPKDCSITCCVIQPDTSTPNFANSEFSQHVRIVIPYFLLIAASASVKISCSFPVTARTPGKFFLVNVLFASPPYRKVSLRNLLRFPYPEHAVSHLFHMVWSSHTKSVENHEFPEVFPTSAPDFSCKNKWHLPHPAAIDILKFVLYNKGFVREHTLLLSDYKTTYCNMPEYPSCFLYG